MITRASAPPSSMIGRSAAPTFSNAGSISSLPSGKASQVCIPNIGFPISRISSGDRSEWTIPLPAVIRLTAPGRIVWKVPRLSRWSIAPSNR